MSNTPLIQFKNAALGYDRRAVLTGVDFAAPAGAFVAILGPNGSGKTTFLKTLLGLIKPVHGLCIARGVHSKSPRYGYVPQKERLDAIYPLSAYEVAAMGTYRHLGLAQRLRDLFKGSRQSFVERCLRECGALDLARKRYSDLSGGQRQRVLIARALAAEPDILVLDEPLAGIDAATQKALLKLLRDFKDRRLTIFMVSHRVEREKGLFTHVVWVDQGKAMAGLAEQMLSERRILEIFKSEL